MNIPGWFFPVAIACAVVALFMWLQHKSPAFAKWVSHARKFAWGLGLVLTAVGAILIWVLDLGPDFGLPIFFIGAALLAALVFLEFG